MVSCDKRRIVGITIGSYLAATLKRPPNALVLAGFFLDTVVSLKAFICGFLSEPLA
jgi:hypothetical protein